MHHLKTPQDITRHIAKSNTTYLKEGGRYIRPAVENLPPMKVSAIKLNQRTSKLNKELNKISAVLKVDGMGNAKVFKSLVKPIEEFYKKQLGLNVKLSHKYKGCYTRCAYLNKASSLINKVDFDNSDKQVKLIDTILDNTPSGAVDYSSMLVRGDSSKAQHILYIDPKFILELATPNEFISLIVYQAGMMMGALDIMASVHRLYTAKEAIVLLDKDSTSKDYIKVSNILKDAGLMNEDSNDVDSKELFIAAYMQESNELKLRMDSLSTEAAEVVRRFVLSEQFLRVADVKEIQRTLTYTGTLINVAMVFVNALTIVIKVVRVLLSVIADVLGIISSILIIMWFVMSWTASKVTGVFKFIGLGSNNSSSLSTNISSVKGVLSNILPKKELATEFRILDSTELLTKKSSELAGTPATEDGYIELDERRNTVIEYLLHGDHTLDDNTKQAVLTVLGGL